SETTTITCHEKFLQGLKKKSIYTQHTYEYHVDKYLQYLGLKSHADLLQGTETDIEDRIIGYLSHLEKAGKSYSTRNTTVSALRLFFTMNRVRVNWEYVLMNIGQKTPVNKDRSYTR